MAHTDSAPPPPGLSTASDEIATLSPDEYGINNLDDATLPPSDRSRIAPAEVVCLVDDDPSVLRSVGRLLESDGFSVSAFSEPESFLEYVAANSVPLVVLDIWMEKMTGMELLAHLCARSPATRVIFITAHEDPAAEATVMQAGAFAFFIKPFDNDQFLNAVHCALGHSLLKKGAVA
jgi:FixJ family two-component response regulator